MTVRSTERRETLLKLALPAPQGSGRGQADEAQPARCGKAAGRLLGAAQEAEASTRKKNMS